MSRIGKLPISIPEGVTVTVNGQTVSMKGKKGELSYQVHPEIQVEFADSKVSLLRKSEEKSKRALHGTMRSILNNMVKGVTAGYEKRLEVRGVGFRFTIAGKKINFSLGFSHPVEFHLPTGISVSTDEENKNTIILQGVDKHLVGQVAAAIRELRPPESYKGKGIRYFGEHITLKQGKKAAK